MNQSDPIDVNESGPIHRYPAFKRFVDGIFLKSPMQRKYLIRHFAKRDCLFWRRAEKFAGGFINYLNEIGLTADEAIDAYLEVCQDMVASQMSFKRTQKYSCPSATEAKAFVYSSNEKMTSYMIGLLLSQFLWPNHYEMYDFFIGESRKLLNIKTILEIGPGHGLYLAESVSIFPDARFDAIDISPTSKKLSEALVFHYTGNTRCKVQISDLNHFHRGRYDYIVMGEVLEHLDDPKSALKKIYNFLNDDGYFFMTTCANAPAIDHVYLYESVEHIRRDLRESGFLLLSELALPVEDIPETQWVQRKAEINYAVMLRKSKILG